MTPTYRSSRPCKHTHPVQKRWTDWGHGQILPMDCPEGEWPIWAGALLVGAVALVAVFVAVMA